METVFDLVWFMGEALAVMLLCCGAWLVHGFHSKASRRALGVVARLAMHESMDRGAALTASKEAATA